MCFETTKQKKGIRMLDLSTARFAFLGFGNMAMAMADGTVIDALEVIETRAKLRMIDGA